MEQRGGQRQKTTHGVHATAVAAIAALSVCMWAAPTRAQYKNTSFGLDTGAWLVTKPNILDAEGQVLPADQRPIRVANGGRLGVESNFKLNSDHWWLGGRVNAGFMRYSPSSSDETAVRREFDRLAAENLGTLLAFQTGVHLRYYFLTERFRPYLQAGISYMHFFSFSSRADATCNAAALCDGSTFASNFLPHPNVGTIQLEPGVEFIVTRDLGIHLFADVQRWLVINASDNVGVFFGLGVIFYS